MIDQLELLLLIRSAEQIDAVENLIVNGLSTFAIEANSVVRNSTTPFKATRASAP